MFPSLGVSWVPALTVLSRPTGWMRAVRKQAKGLRIGKSSGPGLSGHPALKPHV